ncbi:MAG: MBOAT family O-acyltransferase [Pyrinomonadaceae bacterium]
MSLTSGGYLVFLALVFFAHWLLAGSRRLRVLFLLLASYYFYALWNPKFLILLFAISTVDFLTSLGMGRSEKPGVRKLLLFISIFTDLGALFVFKYFNFFSNSTANVMARVGHPVQPFLLTHILLPLGLSFITFRSLSYVIDCYKKTMEPTNRYFDYLAFVAFFPTVTAGPIVRAKELLPQLSARATFSSQDGSRAIFLIIIGLIKKIAIADFIGFNLVGRVFDSPEFYSSIEALAAIYGYALQIYCDFSGYTDIAIGSALLLGLTIPDNFNAPYRAWSLVEFWRRWHITLSKWLGDYLYPTFGGIRKGRIYQYRNMILTMLIAGLWHGAAWTFVLWGGWHGLGITINHWWEHRRKSAKRKPRKQWYIKALCVFVTFHFVCLGWVFFRAGTVEKAWNLLKRLGARDFTAAKLAYPLIAVMVLGFLSHWIPENWYDRIRNGWVWLPSPVQALLLVGIGYGLYYVSGAEVQFIYGNF